MEVVSHRKAPLWIFLDLEVLQVKVHAMSAKEWDVVAERRDLVTCATPKQVRPVCGCGVGHWRKAIGWICPWEDLDVFRYELERLELSCKFLKYRLYTDVYRFSNEKLEKHTHTQFAVDRETLSWGMDAYVQGAQRTVDRVVGELGERDGGFKEFPETPIWGRESRESINVHILDGFFHQEVFASTKTRWQVESRTSVIRSHLRWWLEDLHQAQQLHGHYIKQRNHEVKSRYRQTSWSAEQDAKCLQNWLGGLWPFFFGGGRFEAIAWGSFLEKPPVVFPLIFSPASLDAGETCKLGEQIQ